MFVTKDEKETKERRGLNGTKTSYARSKSSETNLIHDTDSCFSASHGFTQQSPFVMFETLLCFLLCSINCEYAATTQ